jgi:hypothetical protein
MGSLSTVFSDKVMAILRGKEENTHLLWQ